jgi:hypothetical protein
MPVRAEVEYPRAILPDCQPVIATSREGDELLMWLRDGDRVLASARIETTRPFTVG